MICKKLIIKINRLSWSTIIPIITYFIFIALILNFTLPLYKSKNFLITKQYNNNKNVNNNKNHLKLYNSNFNIIIDNNINNPNQIINDNDNNNNNNNNNENQKQQQQIIILSEPKTVIIGRNSINEKNILETAFKEANTNHDQYLSVQELAHYINKRIRKHIDNAIQMNPIDFLKIDISPKDGFISWDEYYLYFLHEKGLLNKQKFLSIINNENNDNKNNNNVSLIINTLLNKKNSIIKNFSQKIKNDIIRDRILWLEAAKMDPYSLTIDEFLAFRHPESSTINLLSLVDDLLRLFDMDGDEHLTIDEFSDVTVSEIDEKYRKSIISKTVEQRHEEFYNIDNNHDGKADRNELLTYVDPRHPRYSLQEAITLLNLTDINRDRKLSFDEILLNSNIFMTSKMIDTSNSFHEEF